MNVKDMAAALTEVVRNSGVEVILPERPKYDPDAQIRFLDSREDDPFFWVKTIDWEEEMRRSACKIEVHKSRFMTNVQEVERVWVRPKAPSKLAGRRGTRRTWKRANPPRWDLQPVGKPKMMFLDPAALFRLTE